MPSSPLFYSQAIEAKQLQQYARGLFEPPSVDVVEFTQPEGGVVRRELAIPYLPGMDSVRVSQARLQLRSRSREMEVDFSVREIDTPGVVIELARPSRLSKVGLSFTVPLGAVPPGQVERIVVRSAVKQGNGFAAGPPLFADPGFGAPGPMFPPPLAGMSATRTPAGAVLTLPRPLGQAWLVQVATGDEAVKLTALAVPLTVRFVRVDAVPRDLVVTLQLAAEAPQIWGYPDLFLPEAGVQSLDFSPLAQKQLSDALTKATPGKTVTLPVALEFRSASGGDLALTSRTLDARYTVDAAGPKGQRLSLGGALTPLSLSAPAALRPAGAAIDLTITPLGRELNAGSAEPPATAPCRGLCLRKDVTAAAASLFVARNAADVAASPLVSVRACVTSRSAAEAVLELRADAAGVPGARLAAPIVRQIEAGYSDWLEFELPAPWTPASAQTRLWVTLRTNSGDLYWYSAPDAAPADAGVVVSLDGGTSWGAPADAIEAARPMLVQLFHAVPDPQPEPAIRLQRGGTVLAENLLGASGGAVVRTGPREFTLSGGGVPGPLATVLAQQTGTGTVETPLLLFSRAVARLQLTRFVLEYDPFQGSAAP